MTKISELPILEDIPKKENHAGWFYALLLIILFFAGWFVFTKFFKWYNSHEIVPQRIIAVTLKLPFAIRTREFQEATQSALPKKEETANEKIIRLVNEKFGTEAPRTLVLLQGESGIKNPETGEWIYRYWAVNPTSGACGLFQALPCEKMPCGSTPADIECQVNWGYEYIKNRYGSSTEAHEFWLAELPHWY